MKSKDRQPEDALVRRRRHLAAWLQEWALDGRLRGAPEAAAMPCRFAPAPSSPAVGQAPRAGAPRPDDILLLPPGNAATRLRPIYVAVLEQLTPGSWLVAPFGPFSLPALPGELRTARRATPLRVLCVWNRATLPTAPLAAAWRVGRLQPRERAWVVALLAHEREATALPAALAARLGPPLLHPLDPRQEYIEEERALWLPERTHLAEAAAVYQPRTEAELRLAAENRERPYRTDGRNHEAGDV